MSEVLFTAIFRVHGKSIDVKKAVNSVIQPYRIDGDRCLHYLVAENAGNAEELADAIRDFLTRNASDIKQLSELDGVAGSILDIGHSIADDKAAQFLRLPSTLLSVVAELGVDVEISFYR